MGSSLISILLVFGVFALGGTLLAATMAGVDTSFNATVVGTSLEGPHEMATTLLGGAGSMIFVAIAAIMMVMLPFAALVWVFR